MLSHIEKAQSAIGAPKAQSAVAPMSRIMLSGNQRLFPDLPAAHISEDRPLGEYYESCEKLGAPRKAMHEYNYEGRFRAAEVEVGIVYWGQTFVHGLTHDITSALEPRLQTAIQFANTPQIDCDWLYGMGPAIQPYLYEAIDGHRCKLKICSTYDKNGKLFEDFYRIGEDACIGDKRNDENAGISAVHLAWMKYHNAIADSLVDVDPKNRFQEAKRIVIRDWHRMLIDYYLPAICDADTLDDVLRNGPSYWQDGFEFAPLEYNHALRYGHSQAPAHIPIDENLKTEPIFRSGHFNKPNRSTNLEWLFPLDPNQDYQRAQKIDTEVAHAFMRLPDGTSLAARNLTRGAVHGMPSFTDIENMMLDDQVFGVVEETKPDDSIFEAGFSQIPLWYGILQEARDRADGERLGPVGSRIIAESTVGLMSLWEESPIHDGDMEPLTLGAWYEVVRG